uniref:Prostaglandin E synthase 2 n=3 Tax=Lygus hesperus TaxID=30085 RepID=A0A0K8TJ45_LYGHE
MMTGVLRIFRFSLVQRPKNLFDSTKSVGQNVSKRFLSETTTPPNPKGSRMRVLILAGAVGGSIGAAYTFYKREGLKKAILNPDGEGLPVIWKELPNVRVSREVVGPDRSLDITLFQYPTCPFCCKVRAFLDFHGLSYKVVEVNPIRKTELKWSEYRKVPILVVKVDDGYIQLNDSSVIISILQSYLLDPDYKLRNVVKFYPNIAYMGDDGNVKKEVLNKYHVMYHTSVPEGQTNDRIANERNWRKWADNNLVHMLSPNVYRTRSEAVESFEWFSKVGEWDKNFSPWEVSSIIQLGSGVMWMLGKRLQKKYNLKQDVRLSLYDSCNNWLKLLKTRGTQFHGGSKPDLADLAVYGVLSSIEGCAAFADLRKNTKISGWYESMKASVGRHDGFLGR